MFPFIRKRKAIAASLNGRRVTVEPGETLLQAALRDGVDFPHGCRVGVCTACRCRLLEGEVSELTDAGEVLSAEQRARGYILACQSVPRTDLQVEVDLSRGGAARRAAAPDAPDETGTSARVRPDAGRPPAGVLDYLKFFLFHAIGLFCAGVLVAGGHWVSLGLLGVTLAYLVGDAVCGDDTSSPRYEYPGVLTTQLWLALPLLTLIVFAGVWSVSPGDPLGFGAAVRALTGHDAIAARDATAFGHHVSAAVLTGLMIGLVGTITAHELVHRTADPFSLVVGRWLLAFSFDTAFSIEHVYGHHRYVSTDSDPATAPRGRNVYRHIVASTLQGNMSAWRIEAGRLARDGRGPWTWRNAVIRGHAMSLALVAAAWAMGGWQAAGFLAVCALWGKALLEIVNYMEHYGIVRDPRTPVQPRHSWNTNRRISSWTMFNLTRHSHHHAQGELAFQDLRPLPGAPMMIGGYLTTILVAMIPPLWQRLMAPRLIAWDRSYASPAERRLAARANARSGLVALQRAADQGGASRARRRAPGDPERRTMEQGDTRR